MVSLAGDYDVFVQFDKTILSIKPEPIEIATRQ
jgi:hypothetical protein